MLVGKMIQKIPFWENIMLQSGQLAFLGIFIIGTKFTYTHKNVSSQIQKNRN